MGTTVTLPASLKATIEAVFADSTRVSHESVVTIADEVAARLVPLSTSQRTSALAEIRSTLRSVGCSPQRARGLLVAIEWTLLDDESGD